MAATEEGRLLMQGMLASATPIRKPRQISLKGLLGTLFVVFGLFLIAAAASRVIEWDVDDLTADTAKKSTQLNGLMNPNNGTHPAITRTEDCVADLRLPVLAGFDAVSYWAIPEGTKPLQGTPDLVTFFSGYRFYFSSIENLRTFERNPLKYIPAWGGFCSFGVANERVWGIDNLGPFGDPTKWVISPIDGRLHIFRSRVPMEKFLESPAEHIEAGNSIWNDWFPADAGLAPLNTACICSAICKDA